MSALRRLGTDCYALIMPKRKPRDVTGFEAELVTLINAASPGGVTLSRTRGIFESGKPGFCVGLETRGIKADYLDSDLSGAIGAARYDLESGDEDPIRPMWHRLSRFQREAVTRLLEMMSAKHMARAARARVGAGASAGAHYALSDAFNAALVELRDVDDIDQHGETLPGTPKLEGPEEPIHVAKPKPTPRRRAARAVAGKE